MTWQVGRFVRGMLDEDVSDAAHRIAVDAVFDPDRIADALAVVERDTPDPVPREVVSSRPPE